MSEDKPSNLWLIAMTMFNVLWAAAASVYLYKSLMFAWNSIDLMGFHSPKPIRARSFGAGCGAGRAY
jgi:hypothetical protein